MFNYLKIKNVCYFNLGASKWSVKFQTLNDRLDPGGREENNEKTIQVDGVVLAAGAWCEYLGSLIDVNIPVSCILNFSSFVEKL